MQLGSGASRLCLAKHTTVPIFRRRTSLHQRLGSPGVFDLKTHNFKVEHVDWETHHSSIQGIRRTVFIEEQGVPEHEEWDNLDAPSQHFLVFKGERAIATARLLDNGKLTRMAVLKEWRKLGVGKMLLEHCIKHAEQNACFEIWLEAQTHAQAFYEKSGFVPEGPVFLDAGIDHIRMRNKLAPVLRFSQRQQAIQLVRTLCADAHRNIELFSQQLTPAIYADKEFIREISAFARRSRNTKIRILVRDTRPLRGIEHGLITLAKRLPSHISVRQYLDGATDPDISYLCVDEQHLLRFTDEENFIGAARVNDRAECKHMREEFQQLWQNQSRADPNLRALTL